MISVTKVLQTSGMVDYLVRFGRDEYRYRVYEPLARKVDKLKKYAPGKAANMLKKANILTTEQDSDKESDAEKLIDFYLKDKYKSDIEPKFKKMQQKGQPIKKDKLSDVPQRDNDSNSDQDITWSSSSLAPYS